MKSNTFKYIIFLSKIYEISLFRRAERIVIFLRYNWKAAECFVRHEEMVFRRKALLISRKTWMFFYISPDQKNWSDEW